MNWKEFKGWMEEQGVKDEDQISYIDTQPGDPFMKATKSRAGWEIN